MSGIMGMPLRHEHSANLEAFRRQNRVFINKLAAAKFKSLRVPGYIWRGVREYLSWVTVYDFASLGSALVDDRPKYRGSLGKKVTWADLFYKAPRNVTTRGNTYANAPPSLVGRVKLIAEACRYVINGRRIVDVDNPSTGKYFQFTQTVDIIGHGVGQVAGIVIGTDQPGFYWDAYDALDDSNIKDPNWLTVSRVTFVGARGEPRRLEDAESHRGEVTSVRDLNPGGTLLARTVGIRLTYMSNQTNEISGEWSHLPVYVQSPQIPVSQINKNEDFKPFGVAADHLSGVLVLDDQRKKEILLLRDSRRPGELSLGHCGWRVHEGEPRTGDAGNCVAVLCAHDNGEKIGSLMIVWYVEVLAFEGAPNSSLRLSKHRV